MPGPTLRRITPCLAFCALAALAGEAEPPLTLDAIEVSAEKRTELAFRTVQIALERGRSDRVEDADLVVCIKETPVGSHVRVINCATNRFWMRIRAASLANGLAAFEANGGPAGSDMMKMATGSFVQRSGMDSVGPSRGTGEIKREDEKVVTIKLSDYNKLRKRYGELPPELREAR